MMHDWDDQDEVNAERCRTTDSSASAVSNILVCSWTVYYFQEPLNQAKRAQGKRALLVQA